MRTWFRLSPLVMLLIYFGVIALMFGMGVLIFSSPRAQLSPAIQAGPTPSIIADNPHVRTTTGVEGGVRFRKGDEVMGEKVKTNDDPNHIRKMCHYKKAPADGELWNGVVNPWQMEVEKARLPDCNERQPEEDI